MGQRSANTIFFLGSASAGRREGRACSRSCVEVGRPSISEPQIGVLVFFRLSHDKHQSIVID